MGDKLSAKQLMQDADVPTLPAEELAPGADLGAAAERVGYPLLIKASAGGGGKGMRVVDQADDFVAKVTATMVAGKGDLLPVSAFPPDGTWPSATSRRSWSSRLACGSPRERELRAVRG